MHENVICLHVASSFFHILKIKKWHSHVKKLMISSIMFNLHMWKSNPITYDCEIQR